MWNVLLNQILHAVSLWAAYINALLRCRCRCKWDEFGACVVFCYKHCRTFR